jgi:hypothetical protein
MPFKSSKQRRYLYSQEPEVAKKFAMEEKKRKRKKGKAKGSSAAKGRKS